MDLSACVYEKVRDKLAEMCAEAVMIFVCVRVCARTGTCFQVRSEPSARMSRPKATPLFPHVRVCVFSDYVVMSVSINIFMIFIYLNIFIRG